MADGRGGDEPVGRIPVQSRELGREYRRFAIDRILDQAGNHQFHAPHFGRERVFDASPLLQHRAFPEADGADGKLPRFPGLLNESPGSFSEGRAVAIHPDECVCVQQGHFRASHSSSSGAMMSPVMAMRFLCRPNGDLGCVPE